MIGWVPKVIDLSIPGRQAGDRENMIKNKNLKNKNHRGPGFYFLEFLFFLGGQYWLNEKSCIKGWIIDYADRKENCKGCVKIN